MPEIDNTLAAVQAEAADRTIQLLEERLIVDKRKVETGRARVRISVSERDEAVEALLLRQDLSIERVPVGTTISAIPAMRQDGDTIIVPIVEEVLVTETRLVLKEELHIRITETKHAETQVVRLRTEHAEIDHDGTAVTIP